MSDFGKFSNKVNLDPSVARSLAFFVSYRSSSVSSQVKTKKSRLPSLTAWRQCRLYSVIYTGTYKIVVSFSRYAHFSRVVSLSHSLYLSLVSRDCVNYRLYNTHTPAVFDCEREKLYYAYTNRLKVSSLVATNTINVVLYLYLIYVCMSASVSRSFAFSLFFYLVEIRKAETVGSRSIYSKKVEKEKISIK